MTDGIHLFAYLVIAFCAGGIVGVVLVFESLKRWSEK